jgi:geranyl-CoA carboxylase alpha subunit
MSDPLSGPFSKLLVANRGEIAARVIRSARALGYPTVAVYSEADAGSPHVALADEAVCIGPGPARDSYLKGEAILEAASRTGADAIHPGYGFLAENAEFATACAWAGLRFVGPPPEAIQLMGDKARAKQRMVEAGVPCVPGFDGDDPSDEDLLAAAEQVGFPLLVKAAAGGGGRGMRRVDAPADLPAALTAARSEATAAFGQGALLLEGLIEDARHVEVQVFADAHGGVIHLGERDCSVQRRFQKVIEEAPSPAVDADLRASMGEAAVAAARAIGYRGAGTVEFLLGPDGAFHFLEMNTRLQVEHPVTELVTGLDLVAWQLRVAAGEPLPLTQADVQLRGHAVEVRLYAEDPYDGHRPQTGSVLAWRPAEGDGLRCDHALRPGLAVTAFYDPMLAKVVAWGESRDEARRKLRHALRRTVLLGLRTNKEFLRAVLDHPAFAAGEVTTGWLGSGDAEDLHRPPPLPPAAVALAAALLTAGPDPRPDHDGWASVGRRDLPVPLDLDGTPAAPRVTVAGAGLYAVRLEGEEAPRQVRLVPSAEPGPLRRVEVDGVLRTAHVAWAAGQLHLELDGRGVTASRRLPQAASRSGGGDGLLRAPASGIVVALQVSVGDRIEAGQSAAVLESMKIESPVTAEVAGVVEEVRVAPGQQVEQGATLVVVTPDAESD